MAEQQPDDAHESTEQRPERPFVDLTTAARALGITPDAVRLRIRRGTLTAHRDGKHWAVQLPETVTAQALAGTDTPLVVALRDELAYLRKQLDAQTEAREQDAIERAELRRLLGNAQQQVQALLPAPREAVDGQPVQTEEQAEQPRRRPSWRRWPWPRRV
jgi:hypothetical protein